MSTSKIIAAVLLAGAISGCQTVQSNVVAFHTLEISTKNTFAVRPVSRTGSLEAATYANLISNELVQKGWAASNSGKIDVVFDFSIDGGRTEVSSVPVFGQTGGGTTFSSGNIYGARGFGSYSGTSYTPATYGVVGSSAVSETVYVRTLVVEMFERSSGKKVYESSVSSKGTSGTFSAVAPCMIESLFSDFPGTSGKSRTVELSRESCMQ
jgi:hypothetical protein